MKIQPLHVFLVAATTLVTPGLAEAGGFAAARFGGEHGHPATDHPTAVYFNPAGLALGRGTRVYLEGLLVYRSLNYSRPEGAIDRILEEGDSGSGTPRDAAAANAGDARLANILASPFVGVVSDLGVEGLAVAGAFYVPFGGSADWDRNEAFADDPTYPGAVDGVQRWAVIEGSSRAMYATAAAAYRLPEPRLSFGLGANLVLNEVSFIRARTVLGTDDVVRLPSEDLVEGRSQIDVSGTTVSVGAGVLWEPLEELRIGASYQSQPGFGKMKLGGTLTNRFGAGTTSTSDVVMEQALPDVFRLGAAWRVRPELEVRLSGDYTRWSVFDKQCLLDGTSDTARCVIAPDGSLDRDGGGDGVIVNLPRDFRDTFGVRAGASYWVTPDIEVLGGAAFDSNAVPDHTMDPSLPDMNKLLGSVGTRWAMSRQFELHATYTHVYYFGREVAPRARDGMGQPIAPESPSRSPDNAGTYEQMIGVLLLGVQASF